MQNADQKQHLLSLNPIRLDADAQLKRLPIWPNRKRPQSFWNAFENHVLYYDCFWSGQADPDAAQNDAVQKGEVQNDDAQPDFAQDVILVGPAMLNLADDFAKATFSTREGQPLKISHHTTRTTLLTCVRAVPRKTKALVISIGGQQLQVPIGPTQAPEISGLNVVSTINKNNDLNWLVDWATYYQKLHDAQAIIVFDNASDHYAPADILHRLGQVAGLAKIMVVPADFKFGPIDRKAPSHPYRYRFLQSALQTIALRRVAASANALLFVDADELVKPVKNGTAFALPKAQQSGVAYFAGHWLSSRVNPGEPSVRHRDFKFKAAPIFRTYCPSKYALDPQNLTITDLNTIPQLHRVWTPKDTKKERGNKVGSFWHFRGISTNWKEKRKDVRPPVPLIHEQDKEWADLAHSIWPAKS